MKRDLASVDEALASPGRPLESALKADMAQRFGHDFSKVRVHSGGAAEQSVREISAHAYTVGHDIVFGAGRYAPHTQDGRRLLAHELTHVVQQPRDSSIVQRDLDDWQRVQDNLENLRQSAEACYQLRQPRRLNSIEEATATSVFGSALETSEVIISEGGPMTIGGYARTLPDRIYFPEGSFTRSDFLAYLIHEHTHVWQYQRGASIPGMVWEAVVGIYKYDDEEGLRKAWADGKAFGEFTTEQQGDILSDYYQRLVDSADVSAYQPFIDDVRSGNETKHRFHSVEPLPAATLDVAKLNAEYRAKTEAEMIRQLKMPMGPNDERAAARAHSIAQLFGRLTYWSTDYRERFAERRSDDVLVNLLFSRLSDASPRRIFKTLGIQPAERARP